MQNHANKVTTFASLRRIYFMMISLDVPANPDKRVIVCACDVLLCSQYSMHLMHSCFGNNVSIVFTGVYLFGPLMTVGRCLRLLG